MGDLLQDVIELRRTGRVQTDLRKSADAATDLIVSSVKGVKAIAGSNVAKGAWNYLKKPIGALGLAAGFLTLSQLAHAGMTAGVEGEVVDRFKTEYLMDGRRSEDEWGESGLEPKVRTLFKDLSSIAPDVAAKAPAAIAAIRPVAQRPLSHFSDQEVKNLVDAQKAMREVKPLGGSKLQAVAPLFKLMDMV